jgi:hypothetical protein
LSSLFPEASLLGLPIIVAMPISFGDKETGVPVLALFLLSSVVNAHHSGLAISRIFSEITIPQQLQMTSPDSGSVIAVFILLHTEHLIDSR